MPLKIGMNVTHMTDPYKVSEKLINVLNDLKMYINIQLPIL